MASRPLGLFLNPAFQVADVASGLLIAVHRVDRKLHRMEQSKRRGLGPDQQLRSHYFDQRFRNEHFRPLGLERPSLSLSSTTPTIRSQPSAPGASVL